MQGVAVVSKLAESAYGGTGPGKYEREGGGQPNEANQTAGYQAIIAG